MDEKSQQLASEWFEKAQADLDFARLGFKETKHYGEVCFLCQQVVEKYLKGFLVAMCKRPRKIHSVGALAKSCAKFNKEFGDLISKCKILDRYYIPPRYPVPSRIRYYKKDAKEAIEIAEVIVRLIKRLLR